MQRLAAEFCLEVARVSTLIVVLIESEWKSLKVAPVKKIFRENCFDIELNIENMLNYSVHLRRYFPPQRKISRID